MTVYLANQRTRKTMNKNEIIEIAGKSFELVPNTSDPLGYLLKPVEEKKPVKAEVIWLNHHEGGTTITRDNPKPFFENEKFVRPMKREDVHDVLFHDGILDHTIQRGVILDCLEELGLIEGGES